MNALELKDFRQSNSLSQEELAEILGKSVATIRSWEQGNRNMPKSAEITIKNYMEKKNAANTKGSVPLYNGRLIEKQHLKTITIIPAKSQLGLQGTMYKEDFINKLETKIIETEDNWEGRYFDVEGVGDSMVNPENPELSIYDGDEIRCREIPRDLYINNKLHIHDWREFTFFHYEKNIFTKHVLEHDVPGRRVLVHSYNPDKELYPDEWIDLNDCYIVANVISVTRPRGLKKRLKKLTSK